MVLQDFISFFNKNSQDEFEYISSGLDIPSIPSEYISAFKAGDRKKYIEEGL
ncbi:MAG: hypothetical protein ACOX0W_05965 [Sphaerochaetaceae bacterium]|jgi:hypothetical protein